MSLLTPSESVAFNGFLSSVDHPSTVEWNGFTPDLADKIPHRHGKEALAKATADLLSLGSPAPSHPSSSKRTSIHSSGALTPSSASSHWPSFSPNASEHPAEPSSSSHTYDRHSAYSFSSYSQSHPHLPALQTLEASSSSGITLPPLSNQGTSRPGLPSSASAPHTGALSKRAHASDEPSPSSSKRARPSASPFPTAPPPAPAPSQPQNKGRRTSSAKRAPAPQPIKPALLSPSQKRANHIQSEQKRRANIRRGYEALCDAVPALREAIRIEDAAIAAASASAAQEGEKNGKRRRKTKREDEKPDGRAGPRSENVVLQKTIDYINALRDDRDTLMGRLNFARGALAPGHPALRIAPAHVDEHGVPLWEREWGGGASSPEDGMDDGEGDGEGEGSDDDE